jgi:TPR repeat protein
MVAGWNQHGLRSDAPGVQSVAMPVSGDEDSDLAFVENLAAAAAGNVYACFELGVCFSTGSHGADCDLIEAHKWFNIAAVGGHEEAANCRADISEEMTAREIAEAQRRARQWIAATSRRAA